MARNRRPCAGGKKRGSVALITDMSQGRPAAILWRFTIPMLLSAVFQQLYNVADSVVAGRFVGEDALAAVGASFPITMIFMAVALGSNTGCSVIISQLFGAKETARMKTAVSTSVIAILALSALLTAGGFLFCEPLMRLLGTPENVFADSQLYLNVYIGGLTFLFLYNICTGVFTALGDSRTPLYFLIASSLANIVMDVVFVVCFHMGVGGVAWATFLCQGRSFRRPPPCFVRRWPRPPRPAAGRPPAADGVRSPPRQSHRTSAGSPPRTPAPRVRPR